MLLNIITPCTRPENLEKIYQSINIPKENYRWIIVFDAQVAPSLSYLCETYAYQQKGSIVGNAQRNFALNLINEGHVYFNDDDTVIHPELWDSVNHLDKDFILFPQLWPDGRLRLEGKQVKLNMVDSHNFIVKRSVIGNLRWEIERYDADGIFAEKCYERASTKTILNKPLSIYNSLRNGKN